MTELLSLLSRFVVAVELIAASLSKVAGAVNAVNVKKAVEDSVEDGPVKDEVKKTTRTRNTKKEEPKGPDLEKLRAEIKQAAGDIAKGDSDECADKFDDLMEEFEVRNVSKLADDQVEDFHKALKKLASKYYDVA